MSMFPLYAHAWGRFAERLAAGTIIAQKLLTVRQHVPPQQIE
jgi:hypothetical protein